MTGPDRAYDADRLATVSTAHKRVPLGEGAPFGYVPIVFVVATRMMKVANARILVDCNKS